MQKGIEHTKIKDEISSLFKNLGIKLKQIILFGSRARGNFNNYSDYDILIITDKTFNIVEKMAISKKVRERLSNFAVDIIIKSEDEVKVLKNQIGTVVRNALKEGVVI